MTVIIGIGVHSGVGRYDEHVSGLTVAKLVVANNNLWILIVNITKASILVQYLRIFDCRVIRALCIVLMLALLPAAFWGIFGGTFLCTPTARLWNPQIAGHCMNAQNYWYSVAGIDIGLDFLILVLPLPAITRLRLPRKQKLGLILVFLLGFFVCVISVVRVCTVLVTALNDNYVASGIWAIVWSAVEANVGIICASLLALKPLLLELCPKLLVDNEIPRHSMRLNMVETEVPASSITKVASALHRPTSTPTSPLSPIKASPNCSRPDTGKTVSPSGSASSPEDKVQSGIMMGARKEQLSLFDMLEQEADETRVQSRQEHRTAREYV